MPMTPDQIADAEAFDGAVNLRRIIAAQAAKVEALEAGLKEACDLLAERTHGSPARSPGHNARLRLERALGDRHD